MGPDRACDPHRLRGRLRRDRRFPEAGLDQELHALRLVPRGHRLHPARPVGDGRHQRRRLRGVFPETMLLGELHHPHKSGMTDERLLRAVKKLKARSFERAFCL
ncbi:putative Protein Rev [Agrobacterium sp. NCPPB 925]|nr:putative Protein Rev [Agrobacterium sp. NCPPB 925]